MKIPIKRRFTIRGLMKLTLLVAVLCTFQYKYEPPYYEARGLASMYHPALKFGVFIQWSGKGFCDKYGPEFGIRYGNDNFAWAYWNRYNDGLFKFDFYSL